MPKPGKSALGTRLLLPLTRPSNHLNVKYLGLNNLCSEYENILYTIVMFPEQDFSPQNTCSLSGYLESLHAVASHHTFCSWVFKLYRITCYCCGCLYYCTCSFRKKETHLFLTTEWRVVQSSWSILEQYMGRWPKAIIQGLLARFSGLFASLRSFVNHSTCSATEPLVK